MDAAPRPGGRLRLFRLQPPYRTPGLGCFRSGMAFPRRIRAFPVSDAHPVSGRIGNNFRRLIFGLVLLAENRAGLGWTRNVGDVFGIDSGRSEYCDFSGRGYFRGAFCLMAFA